jgi:3-deoxy-7-phosphoheptulonate synthase
VTPPWEGIKLAAWDEAEPRKTVVEIGPAKVGAGFTLVAALETAADDAQTLAAARSAKAAGATVLRWPEGGAGDLVRARGLADRAGLPIIVEVTDTKEVVAAAAAADALLVGAANMQNFSLLKELGRSAGKPVWLVRGLHATLKEWLNSAEYVLFEGNPAVVLCDAGIRSFEAGARVVLDLSAIPAVKAISHLPVVLDVGQAGGPVEIERMGLAALAAGVDGLAVGLDPAAGPAAFADLARRFAAMSRLVEDFRLDHD